MNGSSEIVHEAIQEFLMLGFAETGPRKRLRLTRQGQVGVERGDDRTFVTEGVKPLGATPRGLT